MKILIVEDVADMGQLVAHVLSGVREFTVSGTARTAAEARRELLRDRPDLVLLDEVLPGESGLDLLRDLIAQGLPVILLTGLTGPERAARPLPKGALGRVDKPGWATVEEDRIRLRRQIESMCKKVGPTV